MMNNFGLEGAGGDCARHSVSGLRGVVDAVVAISSDSSFQIKLSWSIHLDLQRPFLLFVCFGYFVV